MKGIILAGGSGSRLYPLTLAVSKQLLPIYDKPMIYYPLSTLMLAGIREILIITTPEQNHLFQNLLGDGSKLGIKLSYVTQSAPRGIAEAFILGKEFIGNDPVCLILGDNIFYGHGFVDALQRWGQLKSGALILGYYVTDPERYGVVEFDRELNVVSVEEKPGKPRSSYAITGLYFFDQRVVEHVERIQPSPRGELEITDVIESYLREKSLKVELLGRGFAWLDTGTHDSLLAASNFVEVIEKRQGLKIACLEEIAFRMKFIGESDLANLARSFKGSEYGRYLERIARAEAAEARNF